MTAAESLELFDDFLEAPGRAGETARERPSLGLGTFAFLMGAAHLYLAHALSGRFGLLGLSLASVGLQGVWRLAAGAVETAVVHLAAEAAGGRGRAASLFMLMGLSELVAGALAVPGVLLAQALFPTQAAWAIRAAFWVSGLVAFLLKVRSVRQVHGFGPGRAVFVLLLPWLAFIAAAGGLTLIAAWGAAQQVIQAFS